MINISNASNIFVIGGTSIRVRNWLESLSYNRRIHLFPSRPYQSLKYISMSSSADVECIFHDSIKNFDSQVSSVESEINNSQGDIIFVFDFSDEWFNDESLMHLITKFRKSIDRIDIFFNRYSRNSQRNNYLLKKINSVGYEDYHVRTANCGFSCISLVNVYAQKSVAVADYSKKVLKDIKSNADNVVKQIESYIDVLRLIDRGKFGFDFHGWPISSDLAAVIQRFLVVNSYDLVIEFGSGSSTCVVSETIKLTGGKSRHLAFEHSDIYLDKTRQELEVRGVEKASSVKYSPLVNYKFDGIDYGFYDCTAELDKVARGLTPNSKLLVIVDGPPGRTNRHARYPALPIILDVFSSSDIDLILDDYKRTQEREVGRMWESFMDSHNIAYRSSVLELEKDAAVWQIAREVSDVEG